MTQRLQSVDISEAPALLALAQEVRDSGEPRILRKASEALAIILPIEKKPRRQPKKAAAKADHDALLASFGSWQGLVAPEELKARLKAERGSRRSTARL